jgi:malate synthase
MRAAMKVMEDVARKLNLDQDRLLAERSEAQREADDFWAKMAALDDIDNESVNAERESN